MKAQTSLLGSAALFTLALAGPLAPRTDLVCMQFENGIKGGTTGLQVPATGKAIPVDIKIISALVEKPGFVCQAFEDEQGTRKIGNVITSAMPGIFVSQADYDKSKMTEEVKSICCAVAGAGLNSCSTSSSTTPPPPPPPPVPSEANIKFSSGDGDAASQNNFAVSGKAIPFKATAVQIDLNSPDYVFCQAFSDDKGNSKLGTPFTTKDSVKFPSPVWVNSVCCATSAAALAQCGTSTGSTSTAIAQASTTTAAAKASTTSAPPASSQTSPPLTGKVLTVEVGKDGLKFTPPNTVAAPGDVIEFHYNPKNHSVVQTSFNAPCVTDLKEGFYSGFNFATTSGPSVNTFRVVVNNTKPIWFYCSQNANKHCSSGMVGSVNAPATGNTIDAFLAKAKLVTVNSTSLPDVQGGVIVFGKASTTTPPPPPTGMANIKFMIGDGDAASQNSIPITGKAVALFATAVEIDLNTPDNTFCQAFSDDTGATKLGSVFTTKTSTKLTTRSTINSVCCATSEAALSQCATGTTTVTNAPPTVKIVPGQTVRVQLSGEGEFAVQREVAVDNKPFDLGNLGNKIDTVEVLDDGTAATKNVICRAFVDAAATMPAGGWWHDQTSLYKGLEVDIKSIVCTPKA